MAKVYLMRDAVFGDLLGIFSSPEQIGSVVAPSPGVEDGHFIEEVEVDRMAGQRFRAIHRARIDLDTGEPMMLYSSTSWGFAGPREADGHEDGYVWLSEDHARVWAESTVSPESALALARRLRDEHLSTGKPTREVIARVKVRFRGGPANDCIHDVRAECRRITVPTIGAPGMVTYTDTGEVEDGMKVFAIEGGA